MADSPSFSPIMLWSAFSSVHSSSYSTKIHLTLTASSSISFYFLFVRLWLYTSPSWLEECILFLIESYSEHICLYKISALGFALPSPWASTSTLCWSECSVIQTEGRLEGFVCVYVCWIPPIHQTEAHNAFFTVSLSFCLSGSHLLFCLIAFRVAPGLLLTVFYSSLAHLIWSPPRHNNVVWEKLEDAAHCLDPFYRAE